MSPSYNPCPTNTTLLHFAHPQLLGLNTYANQQPGTTPVNAAFGRFLCRVEDCNFTFESILEELSSDPWPVPSDQRVARSTGAAISVAAGMMEGAMARNGGRVISCSGVALQKKRD